MGEKIYLPHSAQFDEMNANLAKIASILGMQSYTSSWKGVQNAVRAGIAPEIFPVGTQLVVHHDVYGDHLYDVVAHDHYKSVHDENAHTMTLMCHDIITMLPYDRLEALYYAEDELPAGTYNFTNPSAQTYLSNGSHQFTITKDVPYGGILTLSRNLSNSAMSIVVHTSSGADDEILETVSLTAGSGGVNLGTLGVELNDYYRAMSGSNNYMESPLRQFLNSSAKEGEVWREPKTKFDRVPSWNANTAGFLRGLDEEFLAVVGEVSVPCYSNIDYESPDSYVEVGSAYTVNDKFFLASLCETYGTMEQPTLDESRCFPYFVADYRGLIKYLDGVSENWWTRTVPNYSNASSRVYGITLTGGYGPYTTDSSFGVVPVCNIV